MGKIKLNLVSGAVVEKPLINAFKANNNSYIVLDNEMNGSMGLPIILVCKFENNKLIKILDQNEWGIVKEYLKNIIAGNKIEFIKVESELSADDIYYTQLTLPVPSFDALKNAYKVEDAKTEVAEVSIMDIPTNDITPNMSTVDSTPVIEPAVSPVQDITSQPVVDMPVGPQITPEVEVATPVESVVMPTSPMDTISPVNPTIDVTSEPVIEPVAPVIENPVDINPVINTNDSIFQEQKEAFMQACENMFDALVQKFERELENRK